MVSRVVRPSKRFRDFCAGPRWLWLSWCAYRRSVTSCLRTLCHLWSGPYSLQSVVLRSCEIFLHPRLKKIIDCWCFVEQNTWLGMYGASTWKPVKLVSSSDAVHLLYRTLAIFMGDVAKRANSTRAEHHGTLVPSPVLDSVVSEWCDARNFVS